MLTFKNEDLKNSLKEKYPTASKEIDSIDFLPFSNLEQSVRDDVNFLKQHPLVLDETTITGWVYEVESGKVCNFAFLNAASNKLLPFVYLM